MKLWKFFFACNVLDVLHNCCQHISAESSQSQYLVKSRDDDDVCKCSNYSQKFVLVRGNFCNDPVHAQLELLLHLYYLKFITDFIVNVIQLMEVLHIHEDW